MIRTSWNGIGLDDKEQCREIEEKSDTNQKEVCQPSAWELTSF
jgi:hypothetical protein